MPIPKLRGARGPSTRRRPEPPITARAREEAKAQRDRAVRLARIEREQAELAAVDAVAYDALVKLGMRDDEDLEMGSATVRVLAELRGNIFESCLALRLEKHELDKLPCAESHETPPITLRRILVDLGVSRREAARIAGGYAAASDVPDAVRGKAVRDEARHDARLEAEIATLRDRRRKALAVAPKMLDLRHVEIKKIDERLGELQSLISRRKRQ